MLCVVHVLFARCYVVIIIEGSNNTTTDTIEKPPAVDSTVDTGNEVRYPGIMFKKKNFM